MSTASDLMNMPSIDKRMNINTFILVAGFVLTMIMTGSGMLWTYAQVTGQVNQNTRSFMEYRAATDPRITRLESDTRQIDNLAYRVSAAEGTSASISKALEDLKAAVADQSGDLKLVREILQRLDRQASPASFSPTLAVQ